MFLVGYHMTLSAAEVMEIDRNSLSENYLGSRRQSDCLTEWLLPAKPVSMEGSLEV